MEVLFILLAATTDIGKHLPNKNIVYLPESNPVRIEQNVELRRWGRGGGRYIAICGSLTAHFNFKNSC